LPCDPADNERVLRGNPQLHPRVYVGCAKWGRKEWLGKLYAAQTKEKQFLDQYLLHFNSIELNATHYKIMGPKAIDQWAARAGERDFLFCPKLYDHITHRGNLRFKGFLTQEFLRGIRHFGPHLGPVLIQFSDRFSPKRKEELYTFLGSLPPDLLFFVELRHPSWFNNSATRREWLDCLRHLHMGGVITDVAGRRDCCHMELTLPQSFIRFVGNDLHPSDYIRIDHWVSRIRDWLKDGLESLYMFMHSADETYSPELSGYLAEALNSTCGLQIPIPQWQNTPTGLDAASRSRAKGS
jgi:uncharacterized protein YecE (DUF72 family)